MDTLGWSVLQFDTRVENYIAHARRVGTHAVRLFPSFFYFLFLSFDCLLLTFCMHSVYILSMFCAEIEPQTH